MHVYQNAIAGRSLVFWYTNILFNQLVCLYINYVGQYLDLPQFQSECGYKMTSNCWLIFLLPSATCKLTSATQMYILISFMFFVHEHFHLLTDLKCTDKLKKIIKNCSIDCQIIPEKFAKIL